MSDNEINPLQANISSNVASRTTVRVRHDSPELLATIQPSGEAQIQESDDEPIEETSDSRRLVMNLLPTTSIGSGTDPELKQMVHSPQQSQSFGL